MANWSPNNRAATTTWLTLRTLSQIPNDMIFKTAGSVKMNELLFWGKTSTADMRKTQAGTISFEMDNIFRDVRGARFEESVDPGYVVNTIRDTLLDETKTIEDLAGIADKNYQFWGEEE